MNGEMWLSTEKSYKFNKIIEIHNKDYSIAKYMVRRVNYYTKSAV